MALNPCTAIMGGAVIQSKPLGIITVPDALVIPMNRPRKPGVFDAEGRLVPESRYRRGLPTPHLPLEDETAICFGPDAQHAPQGFRYIYVGHLTGHYGHFFFSILARLWSLPRPLPQDVKLVTLNGFHAKDLFSLEFSRSIFQALGITQDHFVNFTRPMKFPDLAVPEPSAEENIGGHAKLAELCNWIGELVSAPIVGDRPIYLTKSRLNSGVYRIVNEDIVCDALERRGFDIIAPETLTFPQQVSLWRRNKPIAGFAGSSLLTSIFTAERRYTALTTAEWINSNQVIIDRLNSNNGKAFYPASDQTANAPGSPFHHDLRLHDPRRVAAELIAVSQ